MANCGTLAPCSIACPGGLDNFGGQFAGKACMVSAAMLLPGKAGWGQFQPVVRRQKIDRALSNTTNTALDPGVNHVINGSHAKISAQYTKREDPQAGPNDIKTFLIGVQLQHRSPRTAPGRHSPARPPAGSHTGLPTAGR